ncbi:MAG: hypothetical protein ACI4MI_00730 [Christensenellales bacterium]
MGVYFDKLWLCIIAFLATVIMLSFVGLKLWLCLLIAFVLSLLIILILMTRNRPYRKTMRYGDWVTYYVIHGQGEFIALLDKLCPSAEITDKKDYILFDEKPVFVWLKLSSISPDSVAHICSVCIKNNIDFAYVICSESNKNALYFSQRISNVKLIFCNIRRVYKATAKQGLLPSRSNRPPLRHTLSVLSSTFLSRSNVKRYVFVSIVLLLFSFITPLTSYYLTISAIALTLAAASLIKSIRSDDDYVKAETKSQDDKSDDKQNEATDNE